LGSKALDWGADALPSDTILLGRQPGVGGEVLTYQR